MPTTSHGAAADVHFEASSQLEGFLLGLVPIETLNVGFGPGMPIVEDDNEEENEDAACTTHAIDYHPSE